MSRITDVQIIREFTNDGLNYGVYSLEFEGEQKVLIRNGNSIGAVMFSLGEPASKCILEIRDDVKREFLQALDLEKGDK